VVEPSVSKNCILSCTDMLLVILKHRRNYRGKIVEERILLIITWAHQVLQTLATG
jgi:hypothetical protein